MKKPLSPDGGSQRPTSTTTRIKTRIHSSQLPEEGQRPTSTTTRIKTVVLTTIESSTPVRDLLPLQQGLRPSTNLMRSDSSIICQRPTSTTTRIKTD
ncbi:MAG: hypothetical protein ACRC6R_08975 [Bacteroidales bacterium]